MANSKPKNALIITTYGELDQYVRGWATGYMNLLILIGRPGTQKSTTVRQAVGAQVCWIDGHATAFAIYCELWESRNQPVVLDDVDSLYADRQGVRLLKAVCQTERTKTVAWLSNAARLDKQGIPRRFTTTSRVAILANAWQTLNANVQAVEDRGHVVLFEPSPLEVHRRTGQWFWDQEVFDFIGARLHLFPELSMRLYSQAWELKNAGIDWRSFIIGRCLSGPARLVAELKDDPSFTSEEERVQAFIARGGGCRATYFNHAKRIQSAVAPPPIRLANRPPVVSDPRIELLKLLRRRQGRWSGNGLDF